MSAEHNNEQREAALAATELQTVEKNAEYVAALEREKEGYQARLARLDDGKQDPADRERLEQLIAGVDAELERLAAGSTAGTKKKRNRAKADG